MKINLGEIELKKKINFGDVKIGVKKVYPKLENIEITPSAEEQIFKHPNSYGYDEVTVKAVETEELTIEPSVEEQVKNGLFGKVTVKPIETEEITINPSMEEQVKEGLFNKVTVKGGYNTAIDDSLMPTRTATSNDNVINRMITKLPEIDVSGWTSTSAMFYLCKGLLEVPKLDTSNSTSMENMFYHCEAITKIPDFNTSNVTSMYGMFYECRKLLEVPKLDTSKVTNISTMFYYCEAITKIPDFNTSKVTNMYNTFYRCKNLIELPALDTSSVNRISRAFEYCSGLISFGGCLNLGKAYTQKTNNYSEYNISVASSFEITHESLMNIINNLYDLNLTYNVANGGTLYTQKLTLGSTNLAKLTSSEIAIATNKGWNVT